MRSVTSNRVLPHWAIEELGQASEAYGLKITVRQAHHKWNWPRLEIAVNCGQGGFRFIVPMREDWEDLRGWHEGDIRDAVEERYNGGSNE